MRKVSKLLKGQAKGKNPAKGQSRIPKRQAPKGQAKLLDGKVTVRFESSEVQYKGFTAPNILRAPETVPTFSRQGSHVLVGRAGSQLSRKFVSSHEAKQAEALLIAE